ncbi:MAG: hypothetical protein EXS43_05505 [Opitutus sp.]|nr:hypothetical protein [Opitutus sp.]
MPTTAGHLAEYLAVDIALDTYPYHGTTTTCDALWMGVPVITLAGEEHRSRVGVSLLTAVGLQEWVAGSPAEYVVRAVELARDRPRLAALKAQLRGRMAASPLVDGRAFTAKLEAAFAAMMRRPRKRGHVVTLDRRDGDALG